MRRKSKLPISVLLSKNPITIKKGKQAELVTRIALQELRDRNVIMDFKREDGSHQDFWLFLPNTRQMRLEVKSGFLHTMCNLKEHSKDPVILVHNGFWDRLTNRRMNRLVKRAKEDIRYLIQGEVLYEHRLFA